MKKAFLFVALGVLLLGGGALAVHARVIGSSVQVVPNGLVGHWTMDGKNVNWVTGVVKDSSVSGNNGMMRGLISTSTSPRAGKVGQAITFDGSDDYVSATDAPSLDLTSAGTVSLWIKLTRQPTGADGVGFTIASKGRDITVGIPNGYALSYVVNAGACGSNYQLRLDLGPGTTYTAITKCMTLDLNTWYHFSGTWTDAVGAIYLNGVSQTTSPTSSSVVPTNNSDPFLIGAGQPANNSTIGAFTPGTIDDVRLYNRALSATEIRTLYGQSSANRVGGTLLTGGSGLLGHWTMDQRDINFTAGTITDRSGRGKTGTLTNFTQSAHLVAGKVSQALRFDSENFINVGNTVDAGATRFTVSAWVKTSASAFDGSFQVILDSATLNPFGNDGFWFGLADDGVYGTNAVRMELATASGSFVRGFANNVISEDRWYHVVASYDGISTVKIYTDGVERSTLQTDSSGTGAYTPSSGNLYIGSANDSSNDTIGNLDDVRIYNRVLTAAEIGTLYRQRAPIITNASFSLGTLASGLVGHWTFDGKNLPWTSATAGTALDSSGNANTGTLTNMSQRSSPVAGKIGQGLKFDGVNDHIQFSSSIVPTGSGARSISFWLKGVTGVGTILSQGTNTGGQAFWLSVRDVFVNVWHNSGDVQLAHGLTNLSSTWNHFVYTYPSGGNNTDAVLYVNGVSKGNFTLEIGSVQVLNTGSAVPRIGDFAIEGSENYFLNGSLDDVRIYNRALSASEVTQLYKNGR